MKNYRFEYFLPSEPVQAQYHPAAHEGEALDIAENLVAAVGATSCIVLRDVGSQREWVGLVRADGSRELN